MRKQEFYRNKYMIGIYAPIYEGETLLALCDNIDEFAKLMKISFDNAATTLYHLFHKMETRILFYGKKCTVEFIEIDKTEEEEDL